MILSLDKICSYYGESQILFDLSFAVEEGSSVCLLGRNGVGKSTTMKTIVGQMNARNKARAGGSIRFAGKELMGMQPFRIARRGIAYVPQGRHIFPNLTVKENLIISERKGVDGSCEWNLDSIYALFPRLKERESLWGKNLSGGEQQMLTIARGLMQNPKLLILDEITEGLAPIVVNQLIGVIQTVKASKVTVLLAEQNVRFALMVSDDSYIMEKGSIVYHSDHGEVTKDVIDRYLSTKLD